MFLNIFMFFPPVGGSQIISSQIHCNACVTVVEKFSRSIDRLKVFLFKSAEQDVDLALAHVIYVKWLPGQRVLCWRVGCLEDSRRNTLMLFHLSWLSGIPLLGAG